MFSSIGMEDSSQLAAGFFNLEDLESCIGEFAESGYFQLLNPSVKEHAGGIITAFLRQCASAGAQSVESLTSAVLETALLDGMTALDLPPTSKQGIPALLSAFFRYVSETGHYPPASRWENTLEALQQRFFAKFREDGSVRGETFRKNYSDVSRNDPCPCGSGKKFKKCCLGLIS
jgi:hypothetical protein